jgi:hypothetical protein
MTKMPQIVLLTDKNLYLVMQFCNFVCKNTGFALPLLKTNSDLRRHNVTVVLKSLVMIHSVGIRKNWSIHVTQGFPIYLENSLSFIYTLCIDKNQFLGPN